MDRVRRGLGGGIEERGRGGKNFLEIRREGLRLVDKGVVREIVSEFCSKCGRNRVVKSRRISRFSRNKTIE